MKLKVTVLYLDGKTVVYKADKFISEGAQWRLDQGSTLLLIPRKNARTVTIEENK